MLISPTEPPKLRARGKVSSMPERFGADVMFIARRERVGVQRKEIKDLIASVQDGRLAKEIGQMRQLSRAMLVVEGKIRWTLDGDLAGQTFGKPWTRRAHNSLLWSVQAEGVAVTGTDSLDETIACVEAYVGWCRKEHHHSLARRPGPVSMWGTPDNRDYAKHVVMGLPGVGSELADRILDKFGFPLGWKVTEEDLVTVEGIGKKKARQLWSALESQ